MKLHTTRPENRSRSTAPGSPDPEWPDTEPTCFRSEAFAEDLTPAEHSAPQPLSQPALRGRARAAGPLLGLALTAMFGLPGR